MTNSIGTGSRRDSGRPLGLTVVILALAVIGLISISGWIFSTVLWLLKALVLGAVALVVLWGLKLLVVGRSAR